MRQSQRSASTCGHTAQASKGPNNSSTRSFTCSNCAGLISPRAIPDWFVTTPTRIPAPRSRRTASTAPGIGSTNAGSVLNGTSRTSVPSRSNNTAAGLRGQGAAVRYRHTPARYQDTAAGGIRTLVATIAAISAGACGPRRIRVMANSAVPAAHSTAAAAPAARRPRENAPAAARPVAVTSACTGRRPIGTPAIRCQSALCRRRIKASSALPRCARTLAHHPGFGRTGWEVRRVPYSSRQPASCTRSARSVSSR
ncbi:MAG: hypothetical protein AUG49_17440 [Catenulispora sp. 13_1_20CM_3_70_7]|nr:MAG: hypothetical protein AUG49_17440 [Catenulispora sp. 13_1_20CM_3_70_7]